jgi:hypothetical protein
MGQAPDEENAVRISTGLIIAGAVALVFGIAVVGFGVPIQEFSFGNTLIVAGATVATGGLIVIALGTVVGQLQHLNDALAHAPMAGQSHDAFESAPPEEQHPFEPRGPSTRPEFPMPPQPAPVLRNPEEPVEVAEDVSLSPGVPSAEPEIATDRPREAPAWMRSRPAPEPMKDEGKRSSIFDSMWPPENRMFGRAETDETTKQDAAGPPPAAEPAEDTASVEPPPAEEKPKPRAIAILKSGVVDGMSYTLYVDGSIEAELPQGTLHFNSIHELRAHLEQNG